MVGNQHTQRSIRLLGANWRHLRQHPPPGSCKTVRVLDRERRIPEVPVEHTVRFERGCDQSPAQQRDAIVWFQAV